MVDYSILSDIGSSSVNEDHADAAKFGNYYVFALADGLGGHGGGDLAAKYAVEAVMLTASRENSFSAELLEQCFLSAQNRIRELQRCGGRARAAKTTLVILMTDGHTAIWGHIGDSRLYWFRNGKLKKRTLDHSVSQMLVASKRIKPEELCHHEDRSMLLRALGANWQSDADYEIDSAGTRLKPGDAFLLCSDGLWEWLDGDFSIMPQLSAGNNVDRLFNDAKNAGEGRALDNITGLLVKI